MTNHKCAFLLALLFLLTSSCKEDDHLEASVPSSSKSYANVDPALWSYWENFEQEALNRGINIDLQSLDLIGTIEKIEEEHVAGSCSFGGNNPRWIRIDADIWGDLNDLYKEFIIFHELGHCVLFRGHEETTTNAGVCTSIMRSGLSGCRDNYNLNSRDSYLDELFGPSR